MKKALTIIIMTAMYACRNNSNCIFFEPKEVTFKNNQTYKVFSKVNNSSIIKGKNATIIKEENIDTTSIGKQTYILNYKYLGINKKYIFTYNVVDTVKPVFISLKSIISTVKGTKVNPCNKIVYADNYDSKPKCSIEGTYDINKVGNYKLKYVITDSSGNKRTSNFTLKVLEKKLTSSSSSSSKIDYIYMKDIIKKYKTNKTSIGIDISFWQGDVDFEKVKKDGVEFVILRMGVQNDNEKSLEMDTKFEEYYKAAKAAGLKVGVYIFNVSTSRQTGIDTAKWTIKNLKGKEIDFPIAYDWENWKWFKEYNMSLYTLSDAYLGFEETLKKNGYDAMLYSSMFYLQNIWMNYENSKVWLAHYTDQTSYKGKYVMWQFTSSGKVNGIKGRVDVNILYK